MYKTQRRVSRSQVRRFGGRRNSARQDARSASASVLREMELSISLNGFPGAEDSILSTVAEQGANIRALCSYSDRHQSVMLLVTEDPPRVKQALEDAGFDCTTASVVVVGLENRIGAIDRLGLHLRDAGINVLRSYASYAGRQEVCAVFKTQDDARAVKVLQAGLGAPRNSVCEAAA
jgi:hypothetical protein